MAKPKVFTSTSWIRRSGALTYAATVTGAGTVNPSFLTLGPDKRCLYAVNEITGAKAHTGR